MNSNQHLALPRSISEDLREFDAMLWYTVQRIATNCERTARYEFALPSDVISLVKDASKQQIEALSCGASCSFVFMVPELKIESILTQPVAAGTVVDLIEKSSPSGQLKLSYWSLVHRVAAQSPEVAHVMFGITRRLSELLSTASTSKLWLISHQDIRVRPRCHASTIRSILKPSKEAKTSVQAALIKFQQALSGKAGA